MTFTIYGLYDPLEPGHVRYIGKTQLDPISRLTEHIRNTLNFKKQTYKLNWLRKVLLENRVPKIFIINETSTEENAFIFEKLYIREHRKAGHKLTNATDGGEGSKGLRHTKESRAKIGAASKDHEVSVEWRAKIGAGNKGKIRSEEMRKKMSVVKKGSTHTIETLKKMSASHKGLVVSTKTRAKISTTLKGHTVSTRTRAKISTSKCSKPWGIARIKAHLAKLQKELNEI